MIQVSKKQGQGPISVILIQEGQGQKVDGMSGQRHSPESTANMTYIPKALFRAKLSQEPLSGLQ